MTIDDVRAAIREIEDADGDNEAQHADEDALHHAVLAAIAKGETDDPRGIAALALTTLEMDFSRWYA